MDWFAQIFYLWLISDTPIVSLELNIHQRILSAIASNVGDCGNDDVSFTRDLIASKVQTRDEVSGANRKTHAMDGKPSDKNDELSSAPVQSRVFMVCGGLRSLRHVLIWERLPHVYIATLHLESLS
jgi:hypothetical protein